MGSEMCIRDSLMQARTDAAHAAGQKVIAIELGLDRPVGLWETAAMPYLFEAGWRAAEARLTDIVAVLEQVRRQGGDFHRLRTRVSGNKSFVDVHVLVPGTMSVHEGHDLVHRLEEEIESAMPHVEVLTHLEPLEDPRSWEDGGRPAH